MVSQAAVRGALVAVSLHVSERNPPSSEFGFASPTWFHLFESSHIARDRLVREAARLTGRDDLIFVFQEPFGAKDWNEVLISEHNFTQPLRADDVPAI